MWYLRAASVVATVALASDAAAAQRLVDLTRAVLPPPVTLFDRGCTVIGDGTRGRPEGLFGVTSAARTRDGTLYVMNIGTGELLAFDRAGSLLRVVAREGDGPGELTRTNVADRRSVRVMSYRGDSLVVFDRFQRRFMVFDTRGRYARTFRPDTLNALSGQVSVIPGGGASGELTLFSTTARRPVARAPNFAGTVLFHDSVTLVRYSPVGRTLWVSPELEKGIHEIVVTLAAGVQSDTARSRTLSGQGRSRAIDRQGSVALAGDLLFHYSETRNELAAFDGAGQPVLLVRLPPMPVAATPSAAAARQTLYVFGDDAGRVWLSVPRSAAGTWREWWVFANSGSLLQTVRTPTSALPLLITTDSGVMLRFDEAGVETIHVCPYVMP